MRDRLLKAFMGSAGTAVFGGVQGPEQIWEPDPLDVPAIHDHAREVFERTFERVLGADPSHPGRMLLLKGDAGCGKTHLLRAFRSSVQDRSRGFFVYLQLRTVVRDYRRYFLSHVVDSLTKQYNQNKEQPSLARLSDLLVGYCQNPIVSNLEDADELGPAGVQECVLAVVDDLRQDERFRELDEQLLRALVMYQAKGDPRYQPKLTAWLRCEDLPAVDRDFLGILTPRLADDDPTRMILGLAKVMAAVDAGLVIAVDQMEDSYDRDDEMAIRRVVEVLRDLSEHASSVLVVLSCLHDYWETARQLLNKSLLDRIELDPEPALLENIRSADECRELVRKRLEALYEEADLQPDPTDPTYPFPPTAFEWLSRENLGTRQVLAALRQWREAAIRAQELPPRFPLVGLVGPDGDSSGSVKDAALDQRWNDFLSTWKGAVPHDSVAVLRCLNAALGGMAEEGLQVSSQFEGDALVVTGQDGTLLAGVCNKGAQGGALTRELTALQTVSKGRRVVPLRQAEFPSGAKTQAAKLLSQIKKSGGWHYVYNDSELRQLLAFESFRVQNQGQDFQRWRASKRPISTLRIIRDGLGLSAQGQHTGEPAITPPLPPPPIGGRQPDPTPAGAIRLGASVGLRAAPVTVPVDDFSRHAAVLGSPGSGKTTLALSIIEHALKVGVSAVLIDRKGDLASYARPDLTGELAGLLGKVDVRLYTPGEDEGWGLGIPLVPDRRSLKAADLTDAADATAQSLAGMLGYRDSQKNLQVMLMQAILTLLEAGATEVDVERIIQLIESGDDAYLARVSRYDPKLTKKLVDQLETLRHAARKLLSTAGDLLDMDRLLKREQRPKLTIISTKFLEQEQSVFFVSQFLSSALRWASRNPAPHLQALVMLDEADIYAPATAQPASKGRVMDLLRRGRSAGLGMILATQNPGDLDYKGRENIKNWFVFKISEQNSINKVKPLLAEAQAGPFLDRVSGFPVGQFLFARSPDAVVVAADRSLLKTDQLSEDDIRAFAARLRKRQRSPGSA